MLPVPMLVRCPVECARAKATTKLAGVGPQGGTQRQQMKDIESCQKSVAIHVFMALFMPQETAEAAGRPLHSWPT